MILLYCNKDNDTDSENSITQPQMTDIMKALLQSCLAQYNELVKERMEHQTQLKFEQERQEERDRIAKEVRERECKRQQELEQYVKEDRERQKKSRGQVEFDDAGATTKTEGLGTTGSSHKISHRR